MTRFLEAFDRAMTHMRKSTQLGIFHLLRKHTRESSQAYEEVYQVVDSFIARAIQRNASGKHDGARQTILVDEMLKETDDRLYLRYQLLHVFVGARDTPAVAVSDVFFQLARLPEVWGKLRAEVLAIREPLSFELFKSMKYLQNVLRESMFNVSGSLELFVLRYPRPSTNWPRWPQSTCVPRRQHSTLRWWSSRRISYACTEGRHGDD